MLTVTYTKGCGLMTWLMGMEYIHIKMELNMKVTGKKIGSMDKAKKCGLMGQPTLVST